MLFRSPTGSLDATHARELGQLLVELNHEYHLAVVVVTHSMELASRMDKVYELTSGKLRLMERS